MLDTEPAVSFSAPVFRVEVITLILYQAGEMGSYFLVEPPYQSALADIKRFYPQLSFSQNVITDPTWIQCGDLMPVSDDTLAKFYYSNGRKWREANLTVFITNESDCDGHGSAYLATALRKLFMSTSFVFDIDNKNKWPTRLETGAGGKSTIAWTTKLFTGVFQYFNWTTIAIVCEAKRNPVVLMACQTLHRGLSSTLRSNITILRIDGFSSETNFTFVMEELNRQTRVILYYVFGQTLRKLMLAAKTANMTQGEHVHVVNIMLRHPVMGSYNWKYGDDDDEAAREAYFSLLLMEKDTSDDFPLPGTDRYYLREGWRNASRERFNTTYTSDIVNFHLTAAYAMLMITAQIVSEFLNANQAQLLTDGSNIARKLTNRTFDLRTGKFGFDQSGSVLVSNFICSQYSRTGHLSTLLKILANPYGIHELRPAHWPGPVWPVPNRPTCGYDGQDPVCFPSNSDSADIAAGTGIALVIIVSSLGILLYIQRRKFSDLLWWVVGHEELRLRLNRQSALDLKTRDLEASYTQLRKATFQQKNILRKKSPRVQ